MLVRIPLTKPQLSVVEAQAVCDVVLSGWISQGEKVAEFEDHVARYTGARWAVAFCNGTAALHAILLALGVGRGDEVIVPSFTFFSTVSSVVHAGGTPVFADVDPRRLTLDPVDVQRRLSARTKVILPVHYGGCPADIDSILKATERRGIVVVEDAAEALGSTRRGRSVGTLGVAGMFSFTPTKIVTSGEGGMVVTNDRALRDQLRLLRSHGQDRLYHHVLFGYNYRMTELQAALGTVQLDRLEEILAGKREVARRLTAGLKRIPGVAVPESADGDTHSYMLYTIRMENRAVRDALMAELDAKGIETRIYFPPVHLQPVFRAKWWRLPVTEDVASRCLSLPCYAGLSQPEIDYLVDSVSGALERMVGRGGFGDRMAAADAPGNHGGGA